MAKYQDAAPIILKSLEDGMTMQEAAAEASVTKQTLYDWINTKPDFSDAVQRARKDGESNAVAKVEATLLKLATGYEYEDVRTEYGSELNQQTGKYEPVIKKQVRTKKTVPANTEAIKFYLTNKAPNDWKNRIEQNNTGNLATDLRIKMVSEQPNDDEFPSSEDEVDTERN